MRPTAFAALLCLLATPLLLPSSATAGGEEAHDGEKPAVDTEPKPRPEATVVMVYEDARLFVEPSRYADYFEARQRVTPRAIRPFVLVERKDGWIELRSFTTADTGPLPICPMPGLTDMKIRLFVEESAVSQTIELKSLPPRKSPALEYATDGCRNSSASPVTHGIQVDDPRAAPPDLEARPQGLGPYLPPKTKLSWPSGQPAGTTRFSVPLPIGTSYDLASACFERPLVGPAGFSSGRAAVTLCARRADVKRD